MSKKIYPSKILLLGEYTILEGAQALAIPYKYKRGHWNTNITEQPSESYKTQVSKYIQFLKDNKTAIKFLHISKMESDLNAGIKYESDIPSGYGLGSSGAVCAAIYDRYQKSECKTADTSVVQNRLATMEGFFHGKSSGIDPLISYYNKPILNGRDKNIHVLNNLVFQNNLHVYLIDSGKPRTTSEWVKIFHQKNENEAFHTQLKNQLIPSVEHAIHFLIVGEWQMFWSHLQIISAFQKTSFSEMFTPEINAIQEKILSFSDKHLIKLCGAGGGGYFLLFTKDQAHLETIEMDLELFKVL